MKVLGKFMGEYNDKNFAAGGYMALEAEWIHVEAYSGVSLEKDTECFLQLGTAYLYTHIKKSNGDYLSPELANSLVKDIALKELVNLDDYDMGFFGIWDILPDSICIRNEIDDDYNTIPLEVVGV